MSTDVWVAIISSIGAVVVGLITGIFAYRGAIAGAKKQIEHERNLTIERDRKQIEFTLGIIKSFMTEEIKVNFLILHNSINDLVYKFKENDKPFNHSMNIYFKFDEFEKGKYQIIHHDDEVVREVFEIYSMFKILQRIKNIRQLNLIEYKEFQRIYKLGLDKYL